MASKTVGFGKKFRGNKLIWVQKSCIFRKLANSSLYMYFKTLSLNLCKNLFSLLLLFILI